MRTEITDYELLARYHESLNKIYGTVKICGEVYEAANALRELNPTAYRCRFADWLDSQITAGVIQEDGDKYYEPE